jgi:chromosome segregation protein
MRLKRVKIFGFKTFADRTEFSLDGGIVAVVGPNGCGKSNLVDAMLWGLGEGSSKHLRASTGQDVIFSGSQKRKGVGYAEVSLCFDNDDGALPIDATEVWITRRLTRNGDSSYSINRQNCRMRDVLELLADSGLGRAGYAIVGQKEIDTALAASADDRRAWIDEAAGVQRFRARKTESLRRLAAARDHLTRTDDIIRELAAQAEPMAEEAELARRYKTVLNSLREVEIGLLVKEICSIVRELSDLETKISSSAELLLSEQEKAKAHHLEAEQLALTLSEIEKEIDDVRIAQQSSMTSLERAEANAKVIAERISGLNVQEQTLFDDSDALMARLVEARADMDAANAEAQAALTNLTDIQTESAGASAQAKALTKHLQDSERDLNLARDQKNRRLKWEAEREAVEARARQLGREIEGIEKSLPQVQSAVDDGRQAVVESSIAVHRVEEAEKSIAVQLKTLRQQEDGEAGELRKTLAEQASLEGRRRGIEATLDSLEGLSQGSKAVLEAVSRGQLSGNYVAVASVIEADKEVSLAIETALGGSGNDLIVNEDRDAKAAIAWLRENRAGRCTFQPISLMRSSEMSSDMRRILGEKGVVGRASELVDCEKRVRPVIDSLLGRVIIVEELDDALRLAKTSGWNRMVTLGGEVVHNSGAVTGGQGSRQGYGLVQRKADLIEIEKELANLYKHLDGAEKRKQNRQNRIQQAEAQGSELETERLTVAIPFKEASDFLRTLEDELRDTERALAKARNELTQLGLNDQGVDDVDVTDFQTKRDEALRELASKSADTESMEARLLEGQERARAAQTREYAAKKRLEAAKEAEANRDKRLGNLGPEREKLAEQELYYQQESERLSTENTALTARVASFALERRDIQERLQNASTAAKSTQENVMVLSGSSHQNELLRARAETRRATTAERLMDAYGLTETDALAQESMHEVPEDASVLVGRLRRELKAMGDVNIGAVEAYERLSERLDELTFQRDDIVRGVEQVEATIAELDKLTRDKFETTFEAVREQFQVMFTQLFGGGSADLLMTETGKVLESGVESGVQLPGKKQQGLQLLSGGERSLCASAFLFALLKVKPAPLVVLDEVDAPLDGRNVERFAEALVQFSDLVQFIVITHNPTTIEVAPNWLGVTMQEPGVSTLIPAKLSDSKAVVREQSAV